MNEYFEKTRERWLEFLSDMGWNSECGGVVSVASLAASFELDEDLEFSDNFRFARSNNELEMVGYAEQRKDGCCGFVDRVIWSEDIAYHVGCNYGH